MESIIALIISGIISVTVAYFTARHKTKTELSKERIKRQLDVQLQQKYKYLLPFKYCADEFQRRLIHINERLSEESKKHDEMVIRFNQDIDKSHDIEWYFNDDIGPKGGYFITSTIYTNCMLFYWMKRIQWEHPYISLLVDESTDDIIRKYEIDRKSINYLSSLNKECSIYNFIKNIKIAIAGANGIPYGLHDSIGDFMFNHHENRIINYEEFCMNLIDDKNRIKFLPVLKFWKNLGSLEKSILDAKINKLRVLILILKILEKTDIREE